KCKRMHSSTCSPHLKLGFKEVIGSCKIIPISLPLYFLYSSLEIFNKSIFPLEELNSILLLSETTAASGNKPIILSAVIDFPEPDSPTIPIIFPFLTEKFRFFKISFLANERERFFISSISDSKSNILIKSNTNLSFCNLNKKFYFCLEVSIFYSIAVNLFYKLVNNLNTACLINYIKWIQSPFYTLHRFQLRVLHSMNFPFGNYYLQSF